MTFAHQPHAYLTVLLVGMVISRLWIWAYFNAEIPLGAFGPLLLILGYLAVAALLWVRAPRPPETGTWATWFVLLLVAAWLVHISLKVSRQEPIFLDELFLPVPLALIALKPIRGRSALPSADVLSWTVVVAVATSLALEMSGAVPSWYADQSLGFADWERSYYWTPLASALGLDGRWGGFAGHPNTMGPIGALLIVYGLGRPGPRKWVFAVAGALVLVLAGSRSAMIAALLGVLVLAALSVLRRIRGRLRHVAMGALAVLGVVVVATLVVVNAGLSGRQDVWPTMLEMWRTSPLLGVGQQGFSDAIAEGALPGWAYHGHNVVIDALVRTGLVGAVLAAAVLVVALIVTGRAALRGFPAGVAMTLVIVINGLGDDIVNWTTMVVPGCYLLVAVLVSDGWRTSEPVSVVAAPTRR